MPALKDRTPVNVREGQQHQTVLVRHALHREAPVRMLSATLHHNSGILGRVDAIVGDIQKRCGSVCIVFIAHGLSFGVPRGTRAVFGSRTVKRAAVVFHIRERLAVGVDGFRRMGRRLRDHTGRTERKPGLVRSAGGVVVSPHAQVTRGRSGIGLAGFHADRLPGTTEAVVIVDRLGRRRPGCVGVLTGLHIAVRGRRRRQGVVVFVRGDLLPVRVKHCREPSHAVINVSGCHSDSVGLGA